MLLITSNGLFSGISASIILITGYLAALGCLLRGKKQNSKLLKFAALFLICGGSFYLGTVCSFANLLLKGTNLSEPIVGQLCYSWAPIGICSSMYVGLTMMKQKLVKPICIFFALTAPIYWIGLWFFPSLTISSDVIEANLAGNLIDIQLIGYINTMTAAYLLSFGFILIPGFFWFAKKTTGVVKKKALSHAIGYILFVACGAMDSLIEFSTFIIIVRLFMVAGYICMYYGFTKSD